MRLPRKYGEGTERGNTEQKDGKIRERAPRIPETQTRKKCGGGKNHERKKKFRIKASCARLRGPDTGDEHSHTQIKCLGQRHVGHVSGELEQVGLSRSQIARTDGNLSFTLQHVNTS